ncbi:glycosyltransferase family 1 protein [Halorubrum ejinorense]|uniref:Glycosyltransferase family 1 protein n=1 Tax=Halorubrum ejinorense TaxID=425309 RepID=A0AAV3SU78_9EURY
MKIGINGLAAKTGGGVTYLQNLVTNILDISDHRIHFFVSATTRKQLNLPTDDDTLTVDSIDVSGTGSRLWYEQTGLPLSIIRQNIDLLYSPSEIPVMWCPCTQVVANQNPNLYYDIDVEKSLRQRVREQALSGALEAAQLPSEATIFVSESSKRKATRELRISEDNAYSVQHGVGSSFANVHTSDAKFPSAESEYILLVSTLYKHKNVHNLIAAYARLPQAKRREHPLLIVGSKTVESEYTRDVENLARELGVAESVSLVGRVSETALRSYYSNAHLFVFPSLIESFGLPVLEAMATGVPVAASANASIPEVGGDAAVYFDPEDPDQMSVVIERALDNQKLREDLVARGQERVRDFTWEKCAKETLNVFERAANIE